MQVPQYNWFLYENMPPVDFASASPPAVAADFFTAGLRRLTLHLVHRTQSGW